MTELSFYDCSCVENPPFKLKNLNRATQFWSKRFDGYENVVCTDTGAQLLVKPKQLCLYGFRLLTRDSSMRFSLMGRLREIPPKTGRETMATVASPSLRFAGNNSLF